MVRIAVARFESIPVTPTFASRAVAGGEDSGQESPTKPGHAFTLHRQPLYMVASSNCTFCHSPRSIAARIWAGVRPSLVCW